MYLGVDPEDLRVDEEEIDPHYEPGSEMDCG